MVSWDEGVRALNHGTKDELQIIGWQPDLRKQLLTALLTVLTGGLLLILITWRPSIKLWLTHRRCDDSEAKRLLVKDMYDQLWEEKVVREEVATEDQKGTQSRVYFINKKIKYVWDEATCTFVRLRPLEHGTTFNTFHRQSGGLSEPTAKAKKALFGENFMKIEILSIWQLIVQQAYNPFYIFQAYTVILWCMQAYYLFAVCIAVLSIVTITIMVWETRRVGPREPCIRKRTFDFVAGGTCSGIVSWFVLAAPLTKISCFVCLFGSFIISSKLLVHIEALNSDAYQEAIQRTSEQ